MSSETSNSSRQDEPSQPSVKEGITRSKDANASPLRKGFRVEASSPTRGAGPASSSSSLHARTGSANRSPTGAKSLGVKPTLGSETSMHAVNKSSPNRAGPTSAGGLHHKRNTSSSSSSTSDYSIPVTVSSPSAGLSISSSLNPNAGGFQPGSLSSLTEVQNEALIS